MTFTIEPMVNQGSRKVSTRGRRLDGGDRRRQALRAIRAHRRGDPRRRRGADPAPRRDAGGEGAGGRKRRRSARSADLRSIRPDPSAQILILQVEDRMPRTRRRREFDGARTHPSVFRDVRQCRGVPRLQDHDLASACVFHREAAIAGAARHAADLQTMAVAIVIGRRGELRTGMIGNRQSEIRLRQCRCRQSNRTDYGRNHQ